MFKNRITYLCYCKKLVYRLLKFLYLMFREIEKTVQMCVRNVGGERHHYHNTISTGV